MCGNAYPTSQASRLSPFVCVYMWVGVGVEVVIVEGV